MTGLLYVAGNTWVHRAPAGLKLSMLALLGGGLFLTERLAVVAAALVIVLALGLVATRLPLRAFVGHLRPLTPWLVALILFHTVVTDWQTGALLVMRLSALVLAAATVTASTRVTALLKAFERILRPLRIFGIRPERVGLVLVMTLRFVPLVADRAQRIREAQAARGASRMQVSMLVPLLVQMLRLAETVGDALDARGCEALGRAQAPRKGAAAPL